MSGYTARPGTPPASAHTFRLPWKQGVWRYQNVSYYRWIEYERRETQCSRSWRPGLFASPAKSWGIVSFLHQACLFRRPPLPLPPPTLRFFQAFHLSFQHVQELQKLSENNICTMFITAAPITTDFQVASREEGRTRSLVDLGGLSLSNSGVRRRGANHSGHKLVPARGLFITGPHKLLAVFHPNILRLKDLHEM